MGARATHGCFKGQQSSAFRFARLVKNGTLIQGRFGGVVMIIRILFLSSIIFLLGSCGSQEGGVFDEISEVSVRLQSKRGLNSVPLSVMAEQRIRECLYTSSVVTADRLDEEVLANHYFVVVEDKRGSHVFELFTKRNLSGVTGNYLEVPCLLPLFKEIERVQGPQW